MKLSLIIPAYNVEDYVDTLIRSLSKQSAKNFEAVFVDDGSTDRTAEKIEAAIRTEVLPQGKLIRTANGGVGSARNRGMEEADGDYLIYLDADDYVAEDLVEAVTASIQADSGSVDAVLWRYLEVDEKGGTTFDYFRDKPKLPPHLSGRTVLGKVFAERTLRILTTAVAYRRALLLRYGIRYTPDCVNGEDQEFIYKAFSRVDRVTFIDRVLTYYVQRNSSVTYTYNVRKFDFADAFQRAAAYMESTEDEELRPLAAVLAGRYTLEDYFYNLRTCLSGASGISVRRLLRDIEKHYPGMNARMRRLIREERSNGVPRSMRLFARSPELYGFLLKFKHAKNRFAKRGQRTPIESAAGIQKTPGGSGHEI